MKAIHDFLREVQDDALFVDSKVEEKREKDENMGTFLMKCALIYIEAQGQRRIWISSEVTLKRVHTLAAENKQA